MPPALPESPAAPTLADGAPDAHGDDSYCALCRRCQMRKKLERRLAAKKEGPPPALSPAHASSATGRLTTASAALCGTATGPPDDAPLDELLLYIGADAAPGSAPRARRKRRTKKAPAAAVVGGDAGDMNCEGVAVLAAAEVEELQEVTMDGEVDAIEARRQGALRMHEVHSPVSDEVVEDDGEDHVDVCAPYCRNAVEGMADRPSVMNTYGHVCVSSIHSHPHAHHHGHQLPHHFLEVDFADEDMTPEEQEAIDQEVEAFRLSLEPCAPSAHLV